MKMTSYYRNRIVLITGAYGGFGKQFALQLIRCGAKVILTDLKSKSLSDMWSEEELQLLPEGWKRQIIASIPADLSSKRGCKKLYEECRKLGVPVEIVVHNAGISFLGEFVDVPAELNEKVIQLNLLSVMHLNQLFVGDLIEQKAGHLIYISSVAGFVATPLSIAYTASKFGLRGLAMALSGEIRRHGVKTSIVYPFWSATPIMESQRYGDFEAKTMPNFYVSKPEDVVREALQGVAKGKVHIRPGFFSKAMWHAVRFWPLIARQQVMGGSS